MSLELEKLFGPDVLAFRTTGASGRVLVVANLSAEPVALPAGSVALASGDLDGGRVPTDTTAWVVEG